MFRRTARYMFRIRNAQPYLHRTFTLRLNGQFRCCPAFEDDKSPPEDATDQGLL